MLSLTINFQTVNIVCKSLCTHPYPQIYRDSLRDRDLARGLGKNTGCCRPFLIESVSQSVSLPQRRGPYARVNTRLVVLTLHDRMVALSTESESIGEIGRRSTGQSFSRSRKLIPTETSYWSLVVSAH